MHAKNTDLANRVRSPQFSLAPCCALHGRCLCRTNCTVTNSQGISSFNPRAGPSQMTKSQALRVSVACLVTCAFAAGNDLRARGARMRRLGRAAALLTSLCLVSPHLGNGGLVRCPSPVTPVGVLAGQYV